MTSCSQLRDRLLRGKQPEALLARDALLGEFVVGAESGGVRGLGRAAVGGGLLQGVNPVALLVEVVHEVHVGVTVSIVGCASSDWRARPSEFPEKARGVKNNLGQQKPHKISFIKNGQNPLWHPYEGIVLCGK